MPARGSGTGGGGGLVMSFLSGLEMGSCAGWGLSARVGGVASSILTGMITICLPLEKQRSGER